MTKTIIIDGKETHYIISDKGEVFNKKTGKFLKGTYARNEYHTVQLTIDGKPKTFMTHRLVAEMFLPNPDNLSTVIHIDEDKYNNSLDNLQWSGEPRRKGSRPPKVKRETVIIEPSDDWKVMPFCNTYLVGRNGQIYNTYTQKMVKGTNRNGYLRMQIDGKFYSVHRLVYETFFGEIPEGMVIDHINGIRDDNRIENLRCITQSENAMNAQSNGHKCQHKVGQYEINSDVLIKEYPSFAAAAREMGVSSGAIISAAKRNGTSCGYKWKEL